MASGTSLLGAGDVAQLRQLKRDALATRLSLKDPSVVITLHRIDPETGIGADLAPTTVALSWDAPAAERSSDSGGTAPVSGTMSAFDPWNVARGDTFALPGGETGSIGFVQPVDAGIVRATFTVDIGR